MKELAARYAQALYLLCPEEETLRTAAGILIGSAELWGVCTDPAIRPEAKKRVLARVLADVPEPLLHFFDLLCDKGRMALLPEILEEFHALALAERGMGRCLMICARVPDPDQQRLLRAKMARLHHKSDVELDIRLDPALIGGFILEIDGVRYDQSVRGRLRALGRRLEGRREV